MRPDLHEANRHSWNEATRAHNSHKADQARFLREGGSTLFPEEIALLGDISGLRLLHLQCNAGQDTLSLAQRGATVTGVDISDEAIGFARQLAADAGIPATFERADIYDWLAAAAGDEAQRFDRVFSSYGAVIWLSDLHAWARGIAATLRPGGCFALVEFHPLIGMLDDAWRVVAPYSGGAPQRYDEGIGDYVAWAGPALAPSGFLEGVQSFANPHPTYEFSWGVGEIIGALLGAGLTLETFVEYPYSNGFPGVAGTVEVAGGRFVPEPGKPQIALMYGLRASKRGDA